MQEPES